LLLSFFFSFSPAVSLTLYEVLRNCFQILTNGKTLTLKFKAEENKRQWGDTLYSLLSSTNKPRDEVRPGRLNFSVLVTGTETRKNASKQEYTAYSININNRTTGFTCTIYKRYREFHSLNKQLRRKYPGHVFRNPLPHKQMLGNLSKETVESRRILLENYLQALLSDSEDFLKSPDFLSFLELNEAILANERARAFSRNIGSGGFGGGTNHSTIITSSLYSPGSSRNLSATTAANIGGPTPLSGGNPVVGGSGGGVGGGRGVGEASLFPAAPSSAQTLLSKVLLENAVPKKM
jgi:hypothetical protein